MAFSPQGGPISVTASTADGSTFTRHYAGSIVSGKVGGGLAIFNDVDVEAYVASVLASEISSSWQPEALRAQAIAVRTYGLRRMRHATSALYDVTDDTTNQVYRGVDSIVPSLQAATDATAGQWLAWHGAAADVWYHSACGGHTASPMELNGVPAAPYLQGYPDADGSGRSYCSASPYYTWRNALSANSIGQVADVVGVTELTVTDRWPSGRVRTVHVQGADGAHEIDGHHFYSRASAVLGYKVVPSSLFDVSSGTGGGFVLTGRGVGHGVGMCQWGAQGRAKAGQTAAQILEAYFPGTTVNGS